MHVLHRSSIFRILLICGFFLFAKSQVNAQCNPPYQFPTGECETAPLVCLQNACYETLDFTGSLPYNGWCGTNTQIHNPQYFRFIAEEEYVEIHIHVDYCNGGGTALQSALLGACPWSGLPDVIDCDDNEEPGGTMVLNSDLFVPGESYWIVIDGSNGATCGYTFTYMEGIFAPEITGELDPAESFVETDVVCQGYEDLYFFVGPALPEAHGYYWVLGWSGDTVTSTLNETTISIPSDIDPGTYTVCARGFSGCDTTETEVCIEITVVDPVPVEKETATFCAEEFPFIWNDVIIDGPGTFTSSAESGGGCDFDSIWTVESYPESPVGQLSFIVCEYPFSYEGEVYDNPGTYPLEYPNSTVNGCDSVAELTLEFGPFTSFIEMNCSEGFSLINQIIEQWDPTDSLTHAWYDCALDTLLSTSQAFTPDTAGCYCLITSGDLCQDTVCAFFSQENCHDLCELVDDYHCEGIPVHFSLDRPVSDQAIIDWRIFHENEPDYHREGADTFSRAFTSQGLYDVYVTVIDSGIATTCYDYFLIEKKAVAALCCDQVICEACTDIVISASVLSTTVTLITGGGPLIISGIAGSATIEVCPDILPYTISIESVVSDLGCVGAAAEPSTITLLSPPVPVIQQVSDTVCVDVPDGATVTWTTCTGQDILSTDNCYVPDTSGCYCAGILYPNGCFTEDCHEFLISANEDISTSDFEIYPNPSNNKFNINLPDAISLPVEWTITDLTGRIITSGIFSAKNNEVAWPSNLASGNYQLQIQAKDGNSFVHALIRM